MFEDTKSRYGDQAIDKQAFFREMFEVHKHLFNYPSLLKQNDLKKVEITDAGVVFTIASHGRDILITCDPTDMHSLPMSYLNFGEYESSEVDVVMKLVRPGDVIFDIGANIGWYTLNLLLGQKGTTVYSFEPIPSSYRLLVNNLKLNHQASGKAFNFGLSDENKKIEFFYDVECAMASSMANLRGSQSTVKVECNVKRLDDVVASDGSLQKLDLIKCDVEGAELFVFKGGIETINRFRPVVFSEMLRKWSKKFGYHPNDIIGLFRSIGYECYVIGEGKITKFGMVDDLTVHTNYLFFDEKKHGNIIEAVNRMGVGRKTECS